MKRRQVVNIANQTKLTQNFPLVKNSQQQADLAQYCPLYDDAHASAKSLNKKLQSGA